MRSGYLAGGAVARVGRAAAAAEDWRIGPVVVALCDPDRIVTTADGGYD